MALSSSLPFLGLFRATLVDFGIGDTGGRGGGRKSFVWNSYEAFHSDALEMGRECSNGDEYGAPIM